MVRVFVLYPDTPDPDRYGQHVELSRREVPTATIRHGRILGSMQSESNFAYYLEFEFPDRDTWKAARDGLTRTAEDAQGLGISFHVYFAELD